MKDTTTTPQTRMIKVIIHAQTKEWYGDEDHVGEKGHGRYKMKGGCDFITTVSEADYMYEEHKIRTAFNCQFDMNGSHMRYEFHDIEFYWEPVPCELKL